MCPRSMVVKIDASMTGGVVCGSDHVGVFCLSE